MNLFKKLSLVTFLGFTLCLSTYASDYASERTGASNSGDKTTIESTGQTDKKCSEVIEQFRKKLELNQQLGDAYLETHKTLVDVYTIWGNKLANVTNLDEIAGISNLFLKSAEASDKAIAESSRVIINLKKETDELMTRMIDCLGEHR